jgi:hypothetical protein
VFIHLPSVFLILLLHVRLFLKLLWRSDVFELVTIVIGKGTAEVHHLLLVGVLQQLVDAVQLRKGVQSGQSVCLLVLHVFGHRITLVLFYFRVGPV